MTSIAARPGMRAAAACASVCIGAQKSSFVANRVSLAAAVPRFVSRKMQGARCEASGATPSEVGFGERITCALC